MFNPFPVDSALEVCRTMLSQIADGSLRIECTGKISERSNQGIMLGALVCSDSKGKRVVLKTNSGISKKLVFQGSEVDDFLYVPPVVEPKKIDEALLKNDKAIHELTYAIEEAKKNNVQKVSQLQKEREELTTESLRAVFELYSFCCADKTVRSLFSICNNALPPTGTGECCAPKLLHYAFKHNLQPLSMCEVFCGPSDSHGKIHGQVYDPCDERCALLLPALLGIEIVYRDNDIIVVNKPSGLLSVPGRGPEKQDCVVNRVKKLFPQCIEQPAVHRLDMETSGLMVLAFTKEAHRLLNKQFENGQVSKSYEALLDGVLAKKGIASDGTMVLYFRLDVENRPHQIWDSVYGKEAITEWHVKNVERFGSQKQNVRHVTRVQFIPHTGRTHQLRLASADSHGFGIPIVGDSLYGTVNDGERLCLHATRLSFVHPITNEPLTFTSACPF